MNLKTIDEFLYIKSIKTIDAYFKYLERGFEIIDPKKNEIPEEKENLIHEYFGENNIEYQVISTTFISEVFHIIETFLKSNLLEFGEYLLYPSIDKYPENKEKLDKYNIALNNEISKTLIDFATSNSKSKENRIKTLSKKVGQLLFTDEKDMIVNSISCSEALYRLEKYLNWNITDEVKERFKLFIENRNEIIHFNNLKNITFASSHSLFILLTFCISNKDKYPKFFSLINYVEPNLKRYNILIQEILFNIDAYKKALPRVTKNAKNISEALSKK